MQGRRLAGVVVFVVSGCIAFYHVLTAAPPAVETMPVSPVVTTPLPRVSEVTASAAPDVPKTVPPSEAVRLRLPGVLSARIGGAIRPNADNALVPPTYTQVFRWADRGQPGCPATDTVFLLGHTVRAGGGVFNRLQTVRRGQAIVLTTETGTVRYEVRRTRLYDKNGITDAAEVYADVPGRLVLVGCFLNPDGSLQTRNFVVTADTVSC